MENEAAIQQERTNRRNYAVNLMDALFFWFGYSFITPSTILPLFASHFTQDAVFIGLIPAIGSVGYLMPQLLTSSRVQRSPLKKFWPVNIGFFSERLPILLMGPVTLLFANQAPHLALAAVFALYAWMMLGAGIIAVGYQDMLAKIIPLRRRGSFIGLQNLIGAAAGILGASTASWLLGRFTFPSGYVWAFSLSGGLIFISWLFLSLTQEQPDLTLSQETPKPADQFRLLSNLLRTDHNYRGYLLSQVIYAFGLMSSGFIIVYASQHWGISDSMAAQFTSALLVGQVIGNFAFGPISDRFGHKIIMELGALTNILAIVLVFVAQSPAWFFIIFGLRGVSMGASMLSGVAINMEFSEPEIRPTYIGLTNTITGVFSAVAPLIGGAIAQGAGYPAMFAISTLFSLVALGVLRGAVKEPRKAQAAA